jgi:hypothetical protein
MIRLTDSQLDQVLSHAAPLARSARHAYLNDVATELGKAGDIGDGTVAKVCREVQRRYWDPPVFAQGTAKYR